MKSAIAVFYLHMRQKGRERGTNTGEDELEDGRWR